MADNDITGKGYDREEAYFRQKDLALIAKKRARLDANRKNAARDDLKCPRCGSHMAEVALGRVKADRCRSCGGVFFDKGELEIMSQAKVVDFFKGVFRKLCRVTSINRRRSGHKV